MTTAKHQSKNKQNATPISGKISVKYTKVMGPLERPCPNNEIMLKTMLNVLLRSSK